MIFAYDMTFCDPSISPAGLPRPNARPLDRFGRSSEWRRNVRTLKWMVYSGKSTPIFGNLHYELYQLWG